MSISTSSSNASNDYIAPPQNPNSPNKRPRRDLLDNATSQRQVTDLNHADNASQPRFGWHANLAMRDFFENNQFNQQADRQLQQLIANFNHQNSQNLLAPEQTQAQVRAFSAQDIPQQLVQSLNQLLPIAQNWNIRRRERDEVHPFQGISTALPRNLNPTVAPQEQNHLAIVTPVPSPLFHLLSNENFCQLRQEPPLPNLNLDNQAGPAELINGNLEIECWGDFCDDVRERRLRISLMDEKLREQAFEENKWATNQDFSMCLEATLKRVRDEGVEESLLAGYEPQMATVDSFLQGRHVGSSNATQAELTQSVLDELLPSFMIDLLTAQSNDLEKRLIIANQLAVMISLIKLTS